MHEHEIKLHDGWSGSEDPESIDIDSVMESVNAVENRYIISVVEQRYGGFDGLDVLDIGVGLGESAVYFARKCARVTAVDISPGMVDFCMRLARLHGVEDMVRTVVGSAEELDMVDGSFDVVYAANVMHHLPDLEKFVSDCHLLLKPGGLFVSIDPLKYNPVINVYRKMAKDVRSETEEPVGFELLEKFERRFVRVTHREFWISALALFLKYYFIDRLDPNKVRYWKHIYKDKPGWGRYTMKTLHKIDGFLTALPGIRRLSWNIVVVAVK